MLTLPKPGIVKPTPARPVVASVSIRPVPSVPVSPAKPAVAPVSSSGSGSTPTVIPRVSLSPVMPTPLTVQYLAPPPAQPPPATDVSGGIRQGLGGIVGGIGGFLTGGIGGAVTGFKTGESLFGGGSSSPALPTLPSGFSGPAQTGVVRTAGGGGINLPFTVYGPGGIPLPGYNPGGGTAVVVHGHYTKGTKKNPSHWTNRRRPRMNPMNVRAGRRAITRIRAAEKLFHRFLSVSHPGHTGRVKPKRIARR